MNHDDFVELATKRFGSCTDILAAKSREYSRANDKLHNFKKASQLMGCSPEKALVGMWLKHVISVLDIVEDIEDDNLPAIDLFAEKATDIINYMVLLEALIAERRGVVK